jgi:hypothetical protein
MSENILLVLLIGVCLVIWLGIYACIYVREEGEEE